MISRPARRRHGRQMSLTANLGANYAWSGRWRVGVQVANVLDEQHWETFGGDLVKRRMLGYVTCLW